MMKVLKVLGLIIFKLALSLSVLSLIVSFSMKGFVSTGMSSVLVTNTATKELFDAMNVDANQVQEVVSNPAVQEFINKYIEPIFGGEIDLNNVDIAKDVLAFLNDNKEMLEKVIGQPLPMEEIESYLNSEEAKAINDIYIEAVNEANKSIPQEVTDIYKSYEYFMSTNFRIIMLVISIVSIVVVALLQKSFYIFIRTLGNTLLWNSVLVGAIVGIFVLFMNVVAADASLPFNIDVVACLKVVIIGGVAGLVLLIAYGIINKIVKEKQEEKKILEF